MTNANALAALIETKTEIDAILARIEALSDDLFGVADEDAGWPAVHTLDHFAKLLDRATSRCFPDGRLREVAPADGERAD